MGGVGGAVAGNLINSHDIQNGTIRSVDIQDGSVRLNDMTGWVQNHLDQRGPRGPQGEQGPSGLEGAIYRVENYTNGGGGDATVACANDETESQKYTAIAGGVGAGHTGSNDFSVTASFPGRMNWDTGKPKPGRLDGWIVLGNGQYTDNLKVWALCVPTTDIPVQQVDLNN